MLPACGRHAVLPPGRLAPPRRQWGWNGRQHSVRHAAARLPLRAGNRVAQQRFAVRRTKRRLRSGACWRLRARHFVTLFDTSRGERHPPHRQAFALCPAGGPKGAWLRRIDRRPARTAPPCPLPALREKTPRRRGRCRRFRQAWPASLESMAGLTPISASARSYLSSRSRLKISSSVAGQLSQPLAAISASSWPAAQPA